MVIYTTPISTDTDGVFLFGTVERVNDGAFDGSTSVADLDLAATPELDPTASGYQVPAGFLPDGATEVVCDG